MRSRRYARWNPRATPADRRRALAVARAVAREEARRAPVAIVLAGSWARGDAHRFSDLDLWVIGGGRGPSLFPRDGFLLSISRKTRGSAMRELRAPSRVGQVVPAWREARILVDRNGTARELAAAARQFRWGSIEGACDTYVRSRLTAWAEEATKLSRLMAEGRWETAAVQRNLLVDGLAGVVAVDRRLFYRENELWERAGEAMGQVWHSLQRAALGLGEVSLERSCAAALALYFRTADGVRAELSAVQRGVIDTVPGAAQLRSYPRA